MLSNLPKNCKNVFVVGVSVSILFFAIPTYAQSSVLDLNDELRAKKKAQRELQDKIATYENKIRSQQKQAKTLKNQISIIDTNISKNELEIQNKQIEAEQLSLESQLVEKQIKEEELRMFETRYNIGNALRDVRKFDDRKYIEVILAEKSFSKVFDQMFYTEKLTQTLKQRLDVLHAVKDILVRNREQLNQNKESAIEKKESLAVMQDALSYEKQSKNNLIVRTKASEVEFKRIAEELQAAAFAIDSEIVTIESNIRSKLDIADKLAGDTGILSWPVSPFAGISATFHDPTYPYRYLFEHGGIDIRGKQGTAIKAPASGYVAKVYNGGYGIRPSYIMILHGNDLTTVFMHVSRIDVNQDTFVARGDTIGLTGGTPNTNGAGRWSTGPHLHFETRLKGIPVNPMGYLP